MREGPRIKKGSVLVYRIFDVAEEIWLDKAEASLQDLRGRETFKVPKFIDRGLIVKSRPVAFGVGDVKLDLPCGTFQASVLGKLRDYGVLSLVYQIPIPSGMSWSELVGLAADLEEGSEIDQIAQRQAREVSELIRPALKQPTAWTAFEDYIVYFLEEFETNLSGDELLAQADIPALLLAEDDATISKKTRATLLDNVLQYGESDLTIVEWNGALVVDPTGNRDVPDILEFAVTQLLEMRYYDDLLDKRLALLYDDIELSKGHSIRGRFAQLYQDASSRYIEFSEFIERVENSLKVVGDFYLATIYRAATKEFRLSIWQQNITRKMNILAQVSSLLQGEVNMRRSHLLEITIVALILFEILSAIFRVY